MAEPRDFSRRSFFKMGALGAAGAAAAGLAGCASPSGSKKTEATTAAGEVASSDAVLKLDSGMPKWSFMVAPDPIADSAITETIEDDIIIVGGGMSGFTTAVSAAEKGASVTLFSAASAPISRGGSNFARNSKVMEELGITPFDPVPYFYHEMRAASFAIDQTKWMRGYNNSEEAMNWMIDIARAAGLDVIMERDNSFDLGPNYAHAFSTLGNSTMVSTGQQGAVEALEAKAKEYGVQIIYDTKAEQLIREDNNTGRVTGVVASKMSDGSYVKFVAKKAVVLATGDFSSNKEMLAAYCPQVLPLVGYEQGEIDYNTSFNLTGIYGGDGQKMGLWIGAAWQHAYPNAPMMQGAWGGSHEPCGFHMGLNVNMNTERYQREDISAPYSSNHLLSQPGNIAYGIWTANYPQAILDKGHEWYTFGMDYTLPSLTPEELVKMWDEGVSTGKYFKADTLDDLAKQLDLDATKLKAVVKRYNELCDKGIDEDFHKNPDFLVKIDEAGPFYAAQNYAMFMTVMGGLRTSVNMEVCDEDDKPIPGLFNVGAMIGDMYANTYNFAVPGNSYGINCLTFGYLLGRDLAAGKFD
ncbi:FAD-dependent oxidoreductase [Denitrobacterium detoxificans]|uniref:FAD-dependent oxidoreductase n=1 Tax=Denitrobacterium detoxificans TaxID=79604 RepID=UPI0026F328AB|nr:FAD-dependent oxidoreductase [Denitrobacterium detoxificans]MBE6465352.1 FAD-dependent oxidoreductase [Denitrobacterium detoxificans]